MNWYKIISLINVIGSLLALLKMTNIVRLYNIPVLWSEFFFIFYGSLSLALVNQLIVFFVPYHLGWPLKMASTLMWIAAFYFCKGLKSESVLK